MPWHIITGKWKETKRVFLEGRNVFFLMIFSVLSNICWKNVNITRVYEPPKNKQGIIHRINKQNMITGKKNMCRGVFFKPAVPFPNLFRLPPSPPPFCSRGETNGRECWGGIIDRCTGYPYRSGLYWLDQIHWDGVWNSTQMQRRIVFIVNAIFKCPPNLTLPASLLKLPAYTTAVCIIYVQSVEMPFVYVASVLQVCIWRTR